jgi:hypothetical protein
MKTNYEQIFVLSAQRMSAGRGSMWMVMNRFLNFQAKGGVQKTFWHEEKDWFRTYHFANWL